MAAERRGKLLVLLTARGISMHGRNLQALGGLEVEHTGHMARAGHLFAISTRSGVTIIDLTDMKRPAITGSVELPSVKAIASGKVLDATTSVIALHQSGAALVEAAARPRVLASYDHPPWAAGTCVAGGVWARVTDDSAAVKLYTLLATTPNLPLPTKVTAEKAARS